MKENLQKLIRLANELDIRGYTKEANMVDNFFRQLTKNNIDWNGKFNQWKTENGENLDKIKEIYKSLVFVKE